MTVRRGHGSRANIPHAIVKKDMYSLIAKKEIGNIKKREGTCRK
jgi:hypothetical protein